MTYKIIRVYEPQVNKKSEVICRGLSLKQARRHCDNDFNRKQGVYVDGYVRESGKEK